MAQLTLAATGQVLIPGMRIQAVTGSHTGTWWRLDAVVHNGREYVVRVFRRVGRLVQNAAFPLHVFGLTYDEMVIWWRTPGRTCRIIIHKIDEWLMAGLFALIPLAVFESCHGAERFSEWLHSL